MMNELVNELNTVMGGYERIARKTKWKLYLEREKANGVKEFFRIDFKTKTIQYYCVSYKFSLKDILSRSEDDEILFNTIEDIMEYIYGG